MPGPYESNYAAPADHQWYHFSSGNLVADAAIFMAGESAVSAYAGQKSMLFSPHARGFWTLGSARGAVGRFLNPFRSQSLSKMAAGMGQPRQVQGMLHQYVKGGAFRQFDLIRDAHRKAGVFRSAAGANASQRIANLIGARASTRVFTGALLTLGVRTAFTAFNIGLGVSVGRGVGEIIANYESPETNTDIQLQSGGFFADTRASFTQRQRAIRAIHNSQLTTRAALGQEASFMHM